MSGQSNGEKAGAVTEFGAKIPVSLVDGFTFVDRINWNNYKEYNDLKGKIKAYRDRFRYYPESVHADKIYRNRKSRQFCKRNGIRFSGPALGRAPKEVDPERKRRAGQDESDRILIEGKFGQGKRWFSLLKIMCKSARTSEAAMGADEAVGMR